MGGRGGICFGSRGICRQAPLVTALEVIVDRNVYRLEAVKCLGQCCEPDADAAGPRL
jgi:hypothetical protein